MNTLTLEGCLRWASGIGCGVLAFWAMNNVRWLVTLREDWKRYAALLISATVAMLAFASLVALRFEPAPIGAIAWIDAFLAVISASVLSSQALHGATTLRRRAEAREALLK